MHHFEHHRLYRTTDPELAIIATRGTLAQWRCRGEGPPYIQYGNRILYGGRDLNAWLDSHIIHPTNAAGVRTATPQKTETSEFAASGRETAMRSV